MLSRLDVSAAELRPGHVSLATIFTVSGYGAALTAIGLVSIVATLALRLSIEVPAFRADMASISRLRSATRTAREPRSPANRSACSQLGSRITSRPMQG